jgi:L-seryl-tRNA(Ser) seleniumtransferase
MLNQGEAVLQKRAERLQSLLGCGAIEKSDAFAGGGSLPEEKIVSRVVCLKPSAGTENALALLRSGNPPVIGRVKEDSLLIDLLTVSDAELPELAAALREVI